MCGATHCTLHSTLDLHCTAHSTLDHRGYGELPLASVTGALPVSSLTGASNPASSKTSALSLLSMTCPTDASVTTGVNG